MATLPAYEPLLESYHRAFERELRHVVSEVPMPDAPSVLDVGCGDGFFSGLWAERLGSAGTLTGVDVSTDYLQVARQRLATSPAAERVKFIQGKIEGLPFGDAAFDVVWCAQSLYSFPEPQAALSEMARVTRPGGVVAILENDTLHHVLLPWPPAIELRLITAEFHALTGKSRNVEKFYVGRELPALFESAGLRTEGSRTFSWDRTGPFDAPTRAFLEAHVARLRERVRPLLSPDDLLQCERYLDPGSRVSVLAAPECAATIIDHLVWGRPAPR